MTAQVRRFVRSRITADPNRGDGHDRDGNPGDCLRACVATVTGRRYEQVPHFAMYVNWWDRMRRWAREHDSDFACVAPVDGSIRHVVDGDEGGLCLGTGPSPRGPWRHVVVVDQDLNLVHDPHPSGLGATVVDEVFVWCRPYGPLPGLVALPEAWPTRRVHLELGRPASPLDLSEQHLSCSPGEPGAVPMPPVRPPVTP